MTMPSTHVDTNWLDLSLIDIPPDARQHDPEKLATLTQDMREQGQLQEIVVAMVEDGRYEVLAGAGRTQAARALGWDKIRASVRHGVSEFDKARITFAENEDREDADPFYQAAQLAKMLKAKNCSQQALADELGISEALVNAYVAIDKLLPEIKKLKRLSLGQLIQICRLKIDKDQIDLTTKTLQGDLSVRQLKALVDKILGKKNSSSRVPRSASRVTFSGPVRRSSSIGISGRWRSRWRSL
jgi:ParB family chromosome partitioning protein